MIERLERWSSGDADLVVVAFSSLPDRFEWGRTLGRTGLSHILLRDTERRWFIDGRDTLAAELAALSGPIVTLGLSQGAHAALWYGRAAKARHVVVVSPVTVAGPEAIAVFPEWKHRLSHDHGTFEIADIAALGPLPPTTAFYSDGLGAELDREMALRIGPSDPRFVPGHAHAALAASVRSEIVEVLRGL